MTKIPPLADRQRPGLSETLPFRVMGLTACWNCGTAGELLGIDDEGLRRWVEADPWDRYDERSPVVILCGRCSDRLIDRHPRLYAPLAPMEPRPGAMPLCIGCHHLDGARCACPLALINGGPGMAVHAPRPTMMHVCRSPRSLSGFVKIYSAWPSRCAGRETLALVPDA